jgi:hypothetical protein
MPKRSTKIVKAPNFTPFVLPSHYFISSNIGSLSLTLTDQFYPSFPTITMESFGIQIALLAVKFWGPL